MAGGDLHRPPLRCADIYTVRRAPRWVAIHTPGMPSVRIAARASKGNSLEVKYFNLKTLTYLWPAGRGKIGTLHASQEAIHDRPLP